MCPAIDLQDDVRVLNRCTGSLECSVTVQKGDARLFHIRSSCLVELHLLTVSLEETTAQLRLQFRDVPRDHRLADMNLLRGKREVQLFRDRDDRLHVPCFIACHNPAPIGARRFVGWDETEALSGSWFLRTILGTNQQDHAQYVSTVGNTHVFFEDKGHPIVGCRVL
jgi:hypothetical protein